MNDLVRTIEIFSGWIIKIVLFHFNFSINHRERLNDLIYQNI